MSLELPSGLLLSDWPHCHLEKTVSSLNVTRMSLVPPLCLCGPPHLRTRPSHFLFSPVNSCDGCVCVACLCVHACAGVCVGVVCGGQITAAFLCYTSPCFLSSSLPFFFRFIYVLGDYIVYHSTRVEAGGHLCELVLSFRHIWTPGIERRPSCFMTGTSA